MSPLFASAGTPQDTSNQPVAARQSCSVQVRPRKPWVDHLFLWLWLAIWTNGSWVLANDILQGPTWENMALALPCFAALVGLWWMALDPWWMKQQIIIDGTELTFLQSRPFRSWVRKYSLTECLCVKRSSRVGSSYFSQPVLAVVIETRGQPIIFGQGLPAEEQAHLAELLEEALEKDQSREEVRSPSLPSDSTWQAETLGQELWLSKRSKSGWSFLASFGFLLTWNLSVLLYLWRTGMQNPNPGFITFFTIVCVLCIGIILGTLWVRVRSLIRVTWRFGTTYIEQERRFLGRATTRRWDVQGPLTVHLVNKRGLTQAEITDGFMTEPSGFDYQLCFWDEENVELFTIESLTLGEGEWMKSLLHDYWS